MMNYKDNPRYQRFLAKYMTLSPDRKALLDTAILDQNFADQDMRKELQGIKLASQKQQQDRSVDLNDRRFHANQDYRNETMDFQDDQMDKAEMLGMANLGLTGYFGYQDMKRRKEREGQVQDLLSLFNNQ